MPATITPTTITPRLLPFDHAARAVGRSEQTLRNWHDRGYVRAYRVPGRRALLLDVAEVRHAIETEPRIHSRPHRASRGPVVALPAASAS